jgi:hypothetical protein
MASEGGGDLEIVFRQGKRIWPTAMGLEEFRKIASFEGLKQAAFSYA